MKAQYIGSTLTIDDNSVVKLGFYEEDWCNFEDKNKIADLDFE